MSEKETILGVDVSLKTYDDLTIDLFERMGEGKKSFVVAINPEKIMKAQEDAALRQLLNEADFQIPDGIGVILASRLKGGQIRSRVTGVDLMMNICQAATQQQKCIFLYGADPGVAVQAKEELEERLPGIQIVGTMDGYEKDEAKVLNTIRTAEPNILFVAMGSPKQEQWILKHKDTLPASVYQGVGGSFDVLAGNVRRAPKLFQKAGMEWFYRLLSQPSRAKRQLALPKFLASVARERS